MLKVGRYQPKKIQSSHLNWLILSTCTAERSFSGLKRLLYERPDERLSSPAILHTHKYKDVTDSDGNITDFALLKGTCPLVTSLMAPLFYPFCRKQSVPLPIVFIYWKCPAENERDGISETLNLRRFWGSMPPDSPRFGRQQRANVYFPCVHLQNLTLRCQLPASCSLWNQCPRMEEET